eukprot:6448087-Pyramimonas_sp.AAC.1
MPARSGAVRVNGGFEGGRGVLTPQHTEPPCKSYRNCDALLLDGVGVGTGLSVALERACPCYVPACTCGCDDAWCILHGPAHGACTMRAHALSKHKERAQANGNDTK